MLVFSFNFETKEGSVDDNDAEFSSKSRVEFFDSFVADDWSNKNSLSDALKYHVFSNFIDMYILY